VDRRQLFFAQLAQCSAWTSKRKSNRGLYFTLEPSLSEIAFAFLLSKAQDA